MNKLKSVYIIFHVIVHVKRAQNRGQIILGQQPKYIFLKPHLRLSPLKLTTEVLYRLIYFRNVWQCFAEEDDLQHL